MKDTIKKISLQSFLLFTVVGLSSCSSNSDDGSDDQAYAESTSVQESVLQVGQSTVASTKFSFSADDVFADKNSVVVAVRVPNGLNYVVGTAEVQRAIDDNDIEPAILICSDGSSILKFNLDSGELSDATNPSGDSDAEITYTVTAVGATASQQIDSSAARNNLLADCGTPFPTQSSAAIVINN